MTVFVALVLLAVTVAVVSYPLFRKNAESPAEAGEDEELKELYSKRDAAYLAIKELEFDLRSGSLSKEDFDDLEAGYRAKAISLLKAIDSSDKVTVSDEASGGDDEIEKEILKLRQVKGRSCPECGERYREGDKFCAQCGATLPRRRAA